MPFSLVWSASVNTLESVAASTAVLISALVWSAVAEASIPFNLVWSASVNTLLSDAASTSVRISAAVWSAVAPVSLPSSFVPSVATSRPSTVPVTVMFPLIAFVPVTVILPFTANVSAIWSTVSTVPALNLPIWSVKIEEEKILRLPLKFEISEVFLLRVVLEQ